MIVKLTRPTFPETPVWINARYIVMMGQVYAEGARAGWRTALYMSHGYGVEYVMETPETIEAMLYQ
jgi:hypothetical protein